MYFNCQSISIVIIMVILTAFTDSISPDTGNFKGSLHLSHKYHKGMDINKRMEEVPNYGIMKDETEDENDISTEDEINGFKRDIATESGNIKTCMVYVVELLNLICQTDNWIVTSLYSVAEKNLILSRCCHSQCSVSSLKMHCHRRHESDIKHKIKTNALRFRPEIFQQMPGLINDDEEMEKTQYFLTPYGFFGEFYR